MCDAARAQLVYLPGFWLGLAGGVAACLLPDLAIMVLRRTLAPFDFHIVQARPALHARTAVAGAPPQPKAALAPE
jgi:hypothetical protein